MVKLIQIVEYFIDNQIYFDFIIRWIGSCSVLIKFFTSYFKYNLPKLQQKKSEFVQLARGCKIAEHETEVKDLHYEMPVSTMRLVMGPLLKHSSCYFPTGKETLEEAEISMLELCSERAECFDGMNCLDVGCGWGSFAFYLAKKYPKSNITCFSNSKAQISHIEEVCREQKITNVQAVLGDLNLPPPEFDNKFDRIIAIELLEHLKNYQTCFETFNRWLINDGKLFIQSFGYRLFPSHFEFDLDQDSNNWIAKYFCKGATMISLDIYLYFQDQLKVDHCWVEKGTHYSKSLLEWVKRMDKNKQELQKEFAEYYDNELEGYYWFSRWRFFLLVSSAPFQLFGGNCWGIGHYLFKKTWDQTKTNPL